MDPRSLTSFAAFSLLATIASGHAGVPAIRAEPVVTADSPTYLTHAPGDETRLFVTERGGMIRVLVGNAFLDTPFLDLTDVVEPVANSGLLGLAFHPDYETNGYFYVHYTPAAANGIDSMIARARIAQRTWMETTTSDSRI